MSDLALPGSIEPAIRKGPNLDSGFNPLSLILFMGVVAGALLYVAYSIYSDVEATHTQVTTFAPYLLLFVALLIALAFEFVNGFHDVQTQSPPSFIPVRSRQISRWFGPACLTCWVSYSRLARLRSASYRCFQWS
jgi:hypothetical protein